jgi:predicted nuclease with RNAse H fold
MVYKVVGIDLSGSEKSNTGICISTNKVIDVFCVRKDEEILQSITEDVKIVGIDAPLSLPYGRKSIHERNKSHFRKCAFTAFLYMKRKTVKLGDEKEGTIIIPKRNKK